jgi:dTDP-glucose 4,6-dehydratase
MSTDEVYGDTISGIFDENSPINPSNPYAATKASADLLIKSWARTNGLEYIIARPSNNYGTNQ